MHFFNYAAYLKGLPLPRLPMVLNETEKAAEGEGGEEGEEEGEGEGEEDLENKEETIRLEKSNILLLGPTGSGQCVCVCVCVYVVLCVLCVCV